jgi:hypothetical protein
MTLNSEAQLAAHSTPIIEKTDATHGARLPKNPGSQSVTPFHINTRAAPPHYSTSHFSLVRLPRSLRLFRFPHRHCSCISNPKSEPLAATAFPPDLASLHPSRTLRPHFVAGEEGAGPQVLWIEGSHDVGRVDEIRKHRELHAGLHTR